MKVEMTFKKLSVLAAATAFAAALPHSPVLAHAKLISEMPAANAKASAAPTQLTLKFSEDLSLQLSGLTVKGPGNQAVATGAPVLDPKDASTLIVPINGTLAAGSYVVVWHALSDDGHKSKGTYTFEIK
jgi:methionine-rich copper-binding protein CopC